MPYINVQFTKGATKEAKREIVKGVTDLMVEHLGKRPEHVHVVIQEVEFGSRPSRWCNFGCGRGPSSGGFGGDV